MQQRPKKKKASKPPPPAIRLGRNSSARNVLKASEHNVLKEEEENVAGLDPSASRSKGLPNQHALLLLQQLNKAVNEPFHPVGLSFYDKVNSVKVDNASKLLKEMSWRDFFQGKTVDQVRIENENKRLSHKKATQYGTIGGGYRDTSPIFKQASRTANEMIRSATTATYSPSPSHSHSHSQRPNSASASTRGVRAAGGGAAAVRNHRNGGQQQQQQYRKYSSDSENEEYDEVEDYDELQPEHFPAQPQSQAEVGMSRMQSVCESLCTRIELLWKELKVSTADRDFYRQTLMRGSLPSAHRNQPSPTFTNAQMMIQCKELGAYVHSLCKFRLDTIHTLRAIEIREMSLQSMWEIIGSASLQEMSNNGNGNGPDQAQKELLVRALKHLQDCTMDVVRNIQMWRRNLWRPLPFLWTSNTRLKWSIGPGGMPMPQQGKNNRKSEGQEPTVNYLIKIISDMDLLQHSEKFVDMMLSVPLCCDDLTCVLFASDDDQEDSESKNSRRLPMNFGPPSSTSGSSGKVLNTNAAGVSPPRAIRSTALRDWFRGDEEGGDIASRSAELVASAAVVREEPLLLRAILAERKLLMSNGVFIPSLRVNQLSASDDTQAPASSAVKLAQHKQQQQQQQQQQAPPVKGSLQFRLFPPKGNSTSSTPIRTDSHLHEQRQKRSAESDFGDKNTKEEYRDEEREKKELADLKFADLNIGRLAKSSEEGKASGFTSPQNENDIDKEAEERVEGEAIDVMARKAIPKLVMAPDPGSGISAAVGNRHSNAYDEKDIRSMGTDGDSAGIYEEDFI